MKDPKNQREQVSNKTVFASHERAIVHTSSTANVAGCTSPVGDQSRQNPRVAGGGTHEVPTLAEELIAVRGRSVFSRDVVL